MWSKKGILAWKNRFNRTAQAYKPSPECVRELPNVIIPGDMCYICKSDKNASLVKMEVLRFIVAKEFAENEGDAVGKLVGLVDKNCDVTWWDVLLVKKNPWKLLSIKADIIDYYEALETNYGSFWPPKDASLHLNGLFEGKSACLLDICHRVKSTQHNLFIFANKEGVYNTEGSWTMRFSEEFTIYSFQDAAIELRNFKESKRQAKKVDGKNEYDFAKEVPVGQDRVDRIRKEGEAIKKSAEIRAFNTAFGKYLDYC